MIFIIFILTENVLNNKMVMLFNNFHIITCNNKMIKEVSHHHHLFI